MGRSLNGGSRSGYGSDIGIGGILLIVVVVHLFLGQGRL
jgi:hypothetical protein